MPVTINGTTGIAGPDGSASTPAVQGTDSNTGLFYPAADTVALSTGGSERMRITSGGVVMVGATSAHGSEKVLINGGGTSPTGDGYLTLRRGSDASSGSGVGVIDFADTRTSSIYAKIQAIADATPGTNDFPGALVFYTTADGASSTTERMRIDSSGNVLIGTTTSPSGSGNISINNGIYSVGVYNNSSGQAANLGIDATNKNFYRSTSSIKYKREVQDAVHGLSELLRLRPVTYKGKSPTDGERVFGGLIAEEVHDAGLTEFVQYSADNDPDALAYGNMVSLCVKAIQELKAIVDAQAARISALEAA